MFSYLKSCKIGYQRGVPVFLLISISDLPALHPISIGHCWYVSHFVRCMKVLPVNLQLPNDLMPGDFICLFGLCQSFDKIYPLFRSLTHFLVGCFAFCLLLSLRVLSIDYQIMFSKCNLLSVSCSLLSSVLC